MGGTSDVRVVEVAAAFWRHAQTYYHRPGGHPGELAAIKAVLSHLKKLYGETPAAEFGPQALKTVRQSMVAAGRCRNHVNRQVGRVKQVFKWATAEELVPAAVNAALQTVAGLKAGRSEAPESDPVKPVPEADVAAVRPHLPPVVRAMVDVQLLTGMRPGEVCAMRGRDLDTTGRLWVYRPASHKTKHHGHDRAVYIGPRAQEVLRPFLRADLAAHLFSPKDADDWHRQQRAKARKTPQSCGNRPGSNVKPKLGRKPGARYSVDAYRRAIVYACERAFGMPADLRFNTKDDPQQRQERAARRAEWHAAHTWHPHQLRHNRATGAGFHVLLPDPDTLAELERFRRDAADVPGVGLTVPLYTVTWGGPHGPEWDRLVRPALAHDRARALEVGCWEGRASRWLLGECLVGARSELTVIDTFAGGADMLDHGISAEGARERFDHNTAPWRDRLRVRAGRSDDQLYAMRCGGESASFDFCYIDASHEAADVLTDSVLVWPLLRPGGILCWDDYGWAVYPEPHRRPGPAIDAMLACFAGRCEVLHRGYQVFVRKTG